MCPWEGWVDECGGSRRGPTWKEKREIWVAWSQLYIAMELSLLLYSGQVFGSFIAATGTVAMSVTN